MRILGFLPELEPELGSVKAMKPFRNAVRDKPKSSSKLLDIDSSSKLLIILTSLYWTKTATTDSQQDVLFVR